MAGLTRFVLFWEHPLKLQQNDKFLWRFFEKFFILLVFTVFTELNILFFEDYSTKKKNKTLKIQNMERRTEFSSIHKKSIKKSNICKIKMIRDKFNLFLHRIDCVRFPPKNSHYFLRLFPWNIPKCAKITNIYIYIYPNITKST